MTIRQKENELFGKWRIHANATDNTFFVQDGTLDPDAYSNSKLKICSILKETPVDGDSETGYVFGDGFQQKIEKFGKEYYKRKGGTLLVLSKRIALILDILYPNQNNDPVDLLSASAYMNLKKYNGTKTSSQKDLENVTKKDSEFLKEQIDEILNPDVLLCGKTRHYLGFIYGGDIKFIIEDPTRKVKLFHLYQNNKPKRLIIEMYHPSHRSSETEQLQKLEEVLTVYRDSEHFLF